MKSWDVVFSLGLTVFQPSTENVLVYGSADPQPNPAELILTQLVANRYQLGWKFFVYRHGKNLQIKVPENFVLPPDVFYLEDIIPENLNLREMAEEVYRLRQEPVIIGYLPREGKEPRKLRGTDVPSLTIAELHELGGWLGGSSIHFFLRLYAEQNPEILYICPFQEKGRVYEVYRGFSRPLFVPTPFVRFVPPSRLNLPAWAPTPWDYWLSLPATFRRRVRKELRRRIFAGERRIEIPLP